MIPDNADVHTYGTLFCLRRGSLACCGGDGWYCPSVDRPFPTGLFWTLRISSVGLFWKDREIRSSHADGLRWVVFFLSTGRGVGWYFVEVGLGCEGMEVALVPVTGWAVCEEG